MTFVANGGSAVETMRNVTTITNEPVTTRSGYVFDGWSESNDLSDNRIAFPYAVPHDTTLYAKWIKEIRTASDLNNVRNNLSDSYRLMADISLADYGTGEGWEPIGDNRRQCCLIYRQF